MAGHRRAWRIVPGDPQMRNQILGEFIRRDYISIGWDIGDSIVGMSDDEIRNKLKQAGYPKVGYVLNQLKTFRDEMKEGDIVIVSADAFIYAVGEITSPYYYETHPTFYSEYEGETCVWTFPHRRRVRWLRITKLPHSELPDKIRKRLQMRPTIIEIDWDMWERLSHIILSP